MLTAMALSTAKCLTTTATSLKSCRQGPMGKTLMVRLRYGYDLRNLLITNTLHISGTGEVLQAQFIYDGDGYRVQQVDHNGDQPVTTTYTNDNSGLS
jgi:hypothetical protein